MLEYLVPGWGNCFGKIRRCDLVRDGESLGVGFAVSKAEARSGLFLTSSLWIRHELPAAP